MERNTTTRAAEEIQAAHRWVPYSILLAALILTAIATWYVAATTRDKDLERFDNAVQQALDRIENRIDTHLALLRGGAALFSTGPIDAPAFHAYVQQLQMARRYPGIQGIGFTARVPADQKEAFVRQMRDQGFTYLTPDGEVRPFDIWTDQDVPEEREEYHAIIYLHPLDRRNHAAIGYDMFTEPTRREAMSRAWATGEPAASGRVRLVQEIEGPEQAGFLIYLPIYRGGAVPPPEKRRELLEGFIYSPLRVDDMLRGVFGTEVNPRVDFQLYDDESVDERRLMHDSRNVRQLSALDQGYVPRFTRQRVALPVAGRTWYLSFATRPEFEFGSQRSWVPVVLPLGLGISFLLFFLFNSLVADIARRKRQEAERLQLLEREREARAEAEILHDIGQVLAAELDLTKLVQALTNAARAITTAQAAAFVYRSRPDPGDSEQTVLHAVAGTSSETLARLCRPENSPLLEPVFQRQGVVRCEDVTAHAQCAALMSAGMSDDPPLVRSFMAVPVVSRSGEPLGALLFGHALPGVFGEREERIAVGIAAQAGITVDNARLYQDIISAQRAAEQANRMKDEFLATLSHELRTPLNAILGWAQLLSASGGSDPAELAQGLETIERNARAQAQLVEDLLDMSRIISGKLRLKLEGVRLEQVIDAAISTVQPAADAKEIIIEKHLDPGIGPITGDSGRLQQVVWNLLSNAIKFTPRRGRVRIGLQRAESHVEIAVSDTGMGIRPDFLPHVFDRFRQADGTSTRTYGGLGLGLSIARHLIELHGGTVKAHSDGEGRGATFTVALPLAAVCREDAPDTMVPAVALAAPQTAKQDLSGLTVLVVDDEPDARELLGRVLRRSGATVLSAASAAEALAAIERTRPDVLVSDIGMPGEDGYSLIRKVRQREAERAGSAGHPSGNIPAVALTAFARAEDRQRAVHAGFQMHVPKPVQPGELTAAVATLAGRTSPRD